MTQTDPGKPWSFGWEELCKKPQWLVYVGGSTEGGSGAASSWCGGWRFAALRWICGSIPSGVIRGTQMKCSGKVHSLTAAICMCLFSFTSRPLHPSLTILDLIIRYDAKVKIHLFWWQKYCPTTCALLLTMTGTRWSEWFNNHASHHPLIFILSNLFLYNLFSLIRIKYFTCNSGRSI